MEGRPHAYIRCLSRIALAAAIVASALPAATPVAGAPPGDLPPCQSDGPADGTGGGISRPWRAILDQEGAVTGHHLTLRHGGVDTEIRTGRRGFAMELGPRRLLLGERDAEGTRLLMLDPGRGCLRWQRRLDGLAFPLPDTAADEHPSLTLHAPGTRAFLGLVAVDPETGATEAVIDGECAGNCQPSDGPIPEVAFGPAGAARPVPAFLGGAWAKDKTLPFRWAAGGAPPTWARTPLKAAAEDVRRTGRSRVPDFVYRTGVTNSVAYASAAPCGGIACASRYLPSSRWNVWILPHGTEYGWGTLRWCQRSASGSCFDLRRVGLHEFGHVTGLNHPESGGFRLAAHETVMHAVTPSKSNAGGGRHAFGRCDVATLQELYDVPNNRTRLSTCNTLESRLTLSASKTAIDAGERVKLKAVLKVADKSAYRQLAGNPLNGRSVKLKYRRAGSDDAWTSAWMQSTFSGGRYELIIKPAATWEFKAAFAAPDDEGLRYSRSDVVKVTVRR